MTVGDDALRMWHDGQTLPSRGRSVRRTLSLIVSAEGPLPGRMSSKSTITTILCYLPYDATIQATRESRGQ